MIVTCVTIYVKRENILEFIEATKENHMKSIKEPGNLRFDFLQAKEDETKFFLYEAYATEEDAAAHKKTAHYMKWRDTVADWMAKPREGVVHKVISPAGVERWQ